MGPPADQHGDGPADQSEQRPPQGLARQQRGADGDRNDDPGGEPAV